MNKVFIFMIIVLVSYSCSKKKNEGVWDDNIKLSTKAAEFSSLGDSITIKTGGDWWWITDVSVNGSHYDISGIDLEADSYKIIRDCFSIERRGKNSLFVKVDKNTLNIERKINIGLEAGDYFDSVIVTQKSN